MIHCRKSFIECWEDASKKHMLSYFLKTYPNFSTFLSHSYDKIPYNTNGRHLHFHFVFILFIGNIVELKLTRNITRNLQIIYGRNIDEIIRSTYRRTLQSK